MDQLINSMPKSLLAIIVMVLALLALRIAQPPHTVCDSQMELFRESQKKFLYSETSGSIVRPALIKELTNICKGDNTPGGCFELFVGLKKMTVDLENVPAMCAETIAAEAPVQSALFGSLKLMVQIAWGTRAPASHMQKDGWFDTSELTVFCALKNQSKRVLGEQGFEEWWMATTRALPQAENLDRRDLWTKSLFGTNCDLYR